MPRRLTISPGIYPSISVSGSGKLTMQPGIYVITGGGFSVSGAGVVSGSGVLIYNAGSNYNGGTGSSFGAFAVSGSGALNLTRTDDRHLCGDRDLPVEGQ